MKVNHKYIFYPIIMILCFACNSGGDDNVGPDDQSSIAQIQLDKLKDKVWTLEEGIRDGEDITVFFSGFNITFSGMLNNSQDNVNGNFSAENGGELFPTSGTWSFVQDDVQNKIMLNSRETSYTLSNNNQRIQIDFQHQSQNGRATGVSGEYSFSLTTQ